MCVLQRVAMRILLAEDDAELRALLASSLSSPGRVVESVNDGLAALERVLDPAKPPIDVIVTDIRMPRMTGVDMLGRLREEKCAVPVVLMTGFGQSCNAAEMEQLGASRIFEKPFDVDDLDRALTLLDTPVAEAEAIRIARSHCPILVAEDDRELRRLLVDALVEAGYPARAASDGRELLSELGAASRGEVPLPHALVVDVRMPRCSGLDVLRAMRMAGWHQPVIVITGFGDPQLHASAVEVGASVVLDKPLDTDDVVSVADVLLAIDARDFRRAS